jgi:hypothetical protein
MRVARLNRRALSGLADRWSQAHAGVRDARRRWPRPGSPLASYINKEDYDERAEQAMIEAASRERLPPLTDEADTFDAYVEHVQASNNLVQPSRSATAEQIKLEAQRHRETRRRLPQPGPFIEEPPWEQPEEPELPAGRFSDAPRPLAAREGTSSAEGEMHEAIAGFRLTPREVKHHLDEHVISQDAAKRALAVAVCDHYNFARACLADPQLGNAHHVKPNILLLGPSGSGKTHLMRALARLLGVPFAKADATKFSATGYVGGDVDDLVRSLVPQAGGDVSLAEFGIVRQAVSIPRPLGCTSPCLLALACTAPANPDVAESTPPFAGVH